MPKEQLSKPFQEWHCKTAGWTALFASAVRSRDRPATEVSYTRKTAKEKPLYSWINAKVQTPSRRTQRWSRQSRRHVLCVPSNATYNVHISCRTISLRQNCDWLVSSFCICNLHINRNTETNEHFDRGRESNRLSALGLHFGDYFDLVVVTIQTSAWCLL